VKTFTHIIPSDQELIDRIKVDDDDAFTQIYTRYWKALLSIAANKIKDLEEAEEIVQDIFVQLWKRRHELEITGELNNYLAVSVKYRVIKVLAKRQSQQKYLDYQSTRGLLLDNSTQEWLDFEELKVRLGELVARLPEKCRLVYQMSKESYCSQKQIAEVLNISEKTVEAHLSKATKSLRAGLTQFLTLTLL
jgi:RNA polymerase sigma-70 factor (family 1)